MDAKTETPVVTWKREDGRVGQMYIEHNGEKRGPFWMTKANAKKHAASCGATFTEE